MSLVFQNIDLPPPSPPGVCGGGWGVNSLEDIGLPSYSNNLSTCYSICIYMVRSSCLMAPRFVYSAELMQFVSLWRANPVWWLPASFIARSWCYLYLYGLQFLFEGSPNCLECGADAICIFMERSSCLMAPRIVYSAELMQFVSLRLSSCLMAPRMVYSVELMQFVS